MATRKRTARKTAKKRVSAKRSAAAKKAWRTRRRKAGMSGLAAKTKGKKVAKKSSASKKRVSPACSTAGRSLKVRSSSRAGRRLATSKRRGGCK